MHSARLGVRVGGLLNNGERRGWSWWRRQEASAFDASLEHSPPWLARFGLSFGRVRPGRCWPVVFHVFATLAPGSGWARPNLRVASTISRAGSAEFGVGIGARSSPSPRQTSQRVALRTLGRSRATPHRALRQLSVSDPRALPRACARCERGGGHCGSSHSVLSARSV